MKAFQKYLKIFQYAMFAVILFNAFQTLADPTDLDKVLAEPNKVNLWLDYGKKLLLTIVTLGGSALTSYLTRFLTVQTLAALGKVKTAVPDKVLVMMSTVISGVFAGVMGATTDMPMNGDTAAIAGATVGAAAQKMANKEPEDLKQEVKELVKQKKEGENDA